MQYLDPHRSPESAFDWDGLPPDGFVVDVGGGIGSTAMFLGTRCENLRFVIQDRRSWSPWESALGMPDL